MLHIHEEAEVAEEVCPNNGLLDFSNEEIARGGQY